MTRDFAAWGKSALLTKLAAEDCDMGENEPGTDAFTWRWSQYLETFGCHPLMHPARFRIVTGTSRPFTASTTIGFDWFRSSKTSYSTTPPEIGMDTSSGG